MPMIGSTKVNLYPLPDKTTLDKFFHSYVDVDRRKAIVVMLKPPAEARVKYGSETFNIAIPWHSFGAILRFSAGICLIRSFIHFFNREPKDTREAACMVPLPNLFESGSICYGRTRPWRGSRIDRYMEDLYRNYWMGRFTNEITIRAGSTPRQISGDIASYHEYTENVLKALEKASKDGAKLTWRAETLFHPSNSSSLQEVLDYLWKSHVH